MVLGDGHAKSSGNECVPAADINLKIDLGLTFNPKKKPNELKKDLIANLKAGDRFDKGFGPKKGSGKTAAECMQLLESLNEDMVTENIDCDWAGSVGSQLKSYLDVYPKMLIGLGGHFFTTAGVKANAGGSYTVTVRDPEKPDTTEEIEFGSDGKVKKGEYKGKKVWTVYYCAVN